MKGIRTFVLQDLSHVLPTKSFQKNLVPSYYLSSSQVHTTSSSRRFWNFFDFSCKEEPASRDKKKCLPSNGIVSSSLFSNDALDAVSKSVSPNSVTTTVTFTPKYINDSQLDLKATSMTCLKIQGLMKQDNLVSLLDGNPVPRTLKWKLKGYKTLRNEQAVDFAFVPGAKSYECDILPRNEYHEHEQSNRRMLPRRKSICSGMENSGENDTLSLTTKAIENKAKIERVKKVDAKDANIVEKESNLERKNISDVDRPANVSSRETSNCELTARALQSAGPKKEEIKYLPILKSELSAATSQTQPVARFCSRPPKKIQKPAAPVLNRTEKEADSAKDVSSMELDEEKKAVASQEKQASSLSKPSAPGYSEVTGSASQRRSMGNRGEERYPMEGEAKARETENDTSAFQSSAKMSRTEPTEFARDSAETSEKSQAASRTSTYFAPRASGGSSHGWNRQSSKTQGNRTFESIIGIPENTTAPLKLSRRNEGQGVKSSPCAATQVRLQQNEGRSVSNSRTNSSGNGRSSMAGSSDGGSRKPPASFAPFTTRRSSSNSSCLSRKPAVSKRTGNGAKSAFNSNNSLNISTCSVNAARKCRDNDARCPRARKCEQERPRSKKDKKICKRYCCPALQTPTQCDYNRFQCPKIKNATQIEKYEVKKDPTCRPNETDEQSREFCTTMERSRPSDRDCKRQTERKCSRERRDRSCDRRRRRSCQREERRDCSRQEEGRTICTKPRKRDTSCKRRRKCNDRDCDRRSAKCTGRRNYTQSAFSNHSTNVPKNVKRYSSLPAFAFPLITMKNSKEARQSLFVSPSVCKFLRSPLVRSKSDDKCKKPSTKCKLTGGKDEDKCKRPSAKCKLNADAKCKKVDSCRKESTKCKKEDPCKRLRGTCEKEKEDPCKKTRGTCEKKKEDPCKKVRATCGKREDPCKRTRTTCGKREDPCKKRTSCGPEVKKVEDPCERVRSASEKKDDPCKKASRPSCSAKSDPCKPSDKLKCSAVKDTKCTLEDSCLKKREQLCQERCMASSTTAESAKERLDRERKEVEECKKHIKKNHHKKKKESATGLKCATNPCKQQLKDSQSKFASIDLPLQSFVNVISNTCMSQGSNLVNLPRDRSYSILNSVNHDEVNRETDSPEPTRNFWSFNDENLEPVITPSMDNTSQDNAPVEDVHSGSTSNWLFSWLNCKY